MSSQELVFLHFNDVVSHYHTQEKANTEEDVVLNLLTVPHFRHRDHCAVFVAPGGAAKRVLTMQPLHHLQRRYLFAICRGVNSQRGTHASAD